jgi:hypothetical protein
MNLHGRDEGQYIKDLIRLYDYRSIELTPEHIDRYIRTQSSKKRGKKKNELIDNNTKQNIVKRVKKEKKKRGRRV